jgi:Bacterial regulatory proteins, luxR family
VNTRPHDPAPLRSTGCCRAPSWASLVLGGIRAIATRLFVTERTIEAHVKQIFLKLGLNTDPDSHRRVLAVLAYLRSAA